MSYAEVLDISYQERVYLIECINEKLEATKKKIEEDMQNMQNMRKK